MMPPSATEPVAVKATVVSSVVSATAVVAAAGFTTRDSKLPPAVPVMVTLSLLGST